MSRTHAISPETRKDTPHPKEAYWHAANQSEWGASGTFPTAQLASTTSCTSSACTKPPAVADPQQSSSHLLIDGHSQISIASDSTASSPEITVKTALLHYLTPKQMKDVHLPHPILGKSKSPEVALPAPPTDQLTQTDSGLRLPSLKPEDTGLSSLPASTPSLRNNLRQRSLPVRMIEALARLDHGDVELHPHSQASEKPPFFAFKEQPYDDDDDDDGPDEIYIDSKYFLNTASSLKKIYGACTPCSMRNAQHIFQSPSSGTVLNRYQYPYRDQDAASCLKSLLSELSHQSPLQPVTTKEYPHSDIPQFPSKYKPCKPQHNVTFSNVICNDDASESMMPSKKPADSCEESAMSLNEFPQEKAERRSSSSTKSIASAQKNSLLESYYFVHDDAQSANGAATAPAGMMSDPSAILSNLLERFGPAEHTRPGQAPLLGLQSLARTPPCDKAAALAGVSTPANDRHREDLLSTLTPTYSVGEPAQRRQPFAAFPPMEGSSRFLSEFDLYEKQQQHQQQQQLPLTSLDNGPLSLSMESQFEPRVRSPHHGAVAFFPQLECAPELNFPNCPLRQLSSSPRGPSLPSSSFSSQHHNHQQHHHHRSVASPPRSSSHQTRQLASVRQPQNEYPPYGCRANPMYVSSNPDGPPGNAFRLMSQPSSSSSIRLPQPWPGLLPCRAGGELSSEPRQVYADDSDRMIYVSWIPKRARAYNAIDKRKMELELKHRLREHLHFTSLAKVLLFPPKGVHCKLIFNNRQSAAHFMEIYGGETRSEATEKWKEDLCRIFDIDMRDKFDKTVVKIEWSQK